MPTDEKRLRDDRRQFIVNSLCVYHSKLYFCQCADGNIADLLTSRIA